MEKNLNLKSMFSDHNWVKKCHTVAYLINSVVSLFDLAVLYIQRILLHNQVDSCFQMTSKLSSDLSAFRECFSAQYTFEYQLVISIFNGNKSKRQVTVIFPMR